jgi:hypothetical protein
MSVPSSFSRWVVSASSDGCVKVMDSKIGSEAASFNAGEAVLSLALDRRSGNVIVGTRSGHIQTWAVSGSNDAAAQVHFRSVFIMIVVILANQDLFLFRA